MKPDIEEASPLAEEQSNTEAQATDADAADSVNKEPGDSNTTSDGPDGVQPTTEGDSPEITTETGGDEASLEPELDTDDNTEDQALPVSHPVFCFPCNDY